MVPGIIYNRQAAGPERNQRQSWGAFGLASQNRHSLQGCSLTTEYLICAVLVNATIKRSPSGWGTVRQAIWASKPRSQVLVLRKAAVLEDVDLGLRRALLRGAVVLTDLLLGDGFGRIADEGVDHVGRLGVVVVQVPRVDVERLPVAVGEGVRGREHGRGGVVRAPEEDGARSRQS